MKGFVAGIYVASCKHGEQIPVTSAQLIAGKGITGDRFYANRKKQVRLNLTLIEAEAIERFNFRYGENIQPSASRRNVITRHIRLNELVGRCFYIGQVLCKGWELCEPCIVMARQFSGSRLPHTEIIRAFQNRGGLRAEILTGGVINLSDPVFVENSD